MGGDSLCCRCLYFQHRHHVVGPLTPLVWPALRIPTARVSRGKRSMRLNSCYGFVLTVDGLWPAACRNHSLFECRQCAWSLCSCLAFVVRLGGVVCCCMLLQHTGSTAVAHPGRVKCSGALSLVLCLTQSWLGDVVTAVACKLAPSNMPQLSASVGLIPAACCNHFVSV